MANEAADGDLSRKVDDDPRTMRQDYDYANVFRRILQGKSDQEQFWVTAPTPHKSQNFPNRTQKSYLVRYKMMKLVLFTSLLVCLLQTVSADLPEVVACAQCTCSVSPCFVLFPKLRLTCTSFATVFCTTTLSLTRSLSHFSQIASGLRVQITRERIQTFALPILFSRLWSFPRSFGLMKKSTSN